MRELTQKELMDVNGGINWKAIGVGITAIGLGITLTVVTGGTALVPVLTVFSAAASGAEIAGAGAAIFLAAGGGAAIGSGMSS